MSATKRRRAANGQRVTRNTRKKTDTWWWECDSEHHPATAIRRAGIPWCGNELTQDEAYAALDRHNTEHHPELTKEPTP